ncbi:MAG: class I SAM-dependent methyltransferase [Gemmatimonadales bacterium]|jgi:SAM-dependent methyltransferase
MPSSLSPTKLLAVLQPWAEVAEAIHRRLAQLVEPAPDQEVVWIGSGSGRSVLWWAGRFGTHIHGVEPDAAAVDEAEEQTRRAGLQRLVSFQTAAPTELPHEEQVFDVTVVNLLHLLGCDGEAVLREAGRVARPMSTVLALAPSWLSTPSEADRAQVAALGFCPQLVVEWKSFFRQAGVVDLSVEDAALDGRWIAQGLVGFLIRGWRAARWAGVRAVLSREMRAFRSLARRRVLGLSIIKGTRWPHE